MSKAANKTKNVLLTAGLAFSCGVHAQVGIPSTPPNGTQNGSQRDTTFPSSNPVRPSSDPGFNQNRSGIRTSGDPRMVTPDHSQQSMNPTNSLNTQSMNTQNIKSAQRALASEGYNISIDGIMGSNTQSALREFQVRRGLSQTGVLDAETLKALNVTPVPAQDETRINR